jgi:hypothetical protein
MIDTVKYPFVNLVVDELYDVCPEGYWAGSFNISNYKYLRLVPSSLKGEDRYNYIKNSIEDYFGGYDWQLEQENNEWFLNYTKK